MHPTQTRVASPPSDDDDGDHLVWDVLDPFAPPDPTQDRLRALIQAELARVRRHESVAPLQPLPDTDSDSDASLSDADSDSDAHEHGPTYPADDADADDEADDDDDDNDDDDDKGAWPHRIVLPRLLHTRPLCFLSSSSPPPSPSPSSSSDEASSPPWLAHTYNDIAEAEERARKERRDAHRLRLKALAILGPEAAPAL